MTDRDQTSGEGGSATRDQTEAARAEPAKPRPAPPPKPAKLPAKAQKPPLPAAGRPARPGPLKIGGAKIPAPAAAPAPAAGAPPESRRAADIREQETITVARGTPESGPQPREAPNPDDFSETHPVSEVVPMVSLPPPGSLGDKYIGCTIDGRYRVLELLGEGGMGVVYRCKRRIFDTEVAVKILRSDFAKNTEATERFVTEAKAASAIGHANIVHVIDFGELPDGSVYFAMEYLAGKTLGELIENGELLGTMRIAHIGRQIAEGLGAAHQAGIVHRDLKPENVFIVEKDGGDFVKILDFGIAKVVGAQNKITRAGAIFGTPHYMSPEQCRGTAVDERTDIYSLGVILYEMATGRPPFDAENPLGILSQHLNESPLPPSSLDNVPELPPGLETVLLRCLAKEPVDRPQSMAEVALALGAVERGEANDDVPITVSLDSSVPPPPGRTPLPSAPFLLARRSLPDGPAAAPPSARAPTSEGGPRAAAPATLMAIVDDADVQAFKKAQRGRRWPFVIAAVLLLVGAAWATHGVWLPKPPLLSEAFQVARPFVLAGQVSQPPATKPSNTASVALLLSPIDAKVYRGKEELGSMPISVDVVPGEKLKLTVKRDGFWPRKIVVDGTKPKVLVRLAPIPGQKPKVPVPTQSPEQLGVSAEDEATDAPSEDDEVVEEEAPKPKAGAKGAPKHGAGKPKEAPAAPDKAAPEAPAE